MGDFPHDLPSLVIGALLGAVFGAIFTLIGSYVMWRWQLGEERKQRRAERIVRAIHLTISSLTHTRSLLYSKTQGITGVLNLPENPIDELMALATLFLHEIEPMVQKLHDMQQKLFAHNIHEPGAADSMLRLANEFSPIANQVMTELRRLSRAQGTTKAA